MAKTIAELVIKKWVEENLPGAKVTVEGRAGKVTDINGDSIDVAYDPEGKRILFLDTYL